MTFIWKSLRAIVVLAAYGALGYLVWKKVQPEAALPASPYPAPGARATSPSDEPRGPIAPALVAADAAEVDRIAAEVLPEDGIDLSLPLAVGDIDRAD